MKVISKNPYANGKNAIAMYELVKDIGQFIIDRPFTNIKINAQELNISINTFTFRLRGALVFYKQFLPGVTSNNKELIAMFGMDFKLFVSRLSAIIRIKQDGLVVTLQHKKTITDNIDTIKEKEVTILDMGNYFRFADYADSVAMRQHTNIPKLPTVRELILNPPKPSSADHELETNSGDGVIDLVGWLHSFKNGNKPADFVADNLETLSDNLLQELGQLNAEGVIKFEYNDDGSITFKAL